MTPTSPGVSQVSIIKKPRDLSLLRDPKILSALTPASKLQTKRESLYVESLYDNKITPINYGSATQVSGDVSSTLEVGLHVIATALEKQHWSCVVDPSGKASSLALYEAALASPRFVCVRSFSPTRFASTLSHLVSSMRVVVAMIPTQISATQMARVMSRVRENNSILIFLDPYSLAHSSFDRRIVAKTISFEGLNVGGGVLMKRNMEIEEYEHGVKLAGSVPVAGTDPAKGLAVVSLPKKVVNG